MSEGPAYAARGHEHDSRDRVPGAQAGQAPRGRLGGPGWFAFGAIVKIGVLVFGPIAARPRRMLLIVTDDALRVIRSCS